MATELSRLIRGVSRFATTAVVVSTGLVVATSGPAAAACTSGLFRGTDFGYKTATTLVTNAINVEGYLETPLSSSEVTGYSPNLPSAADVYIVNGSDFVQAGWYLGTAGGMPYTTVPRLWIGEHTGVNTEALRAGPTLGWASFYNIEIVRTTGNFYNVYSNGSVKFTTNLSHFSSGSPSFNGEVDSTCTIMRGRAFRSASPLRTLQYQLSTGGWVYFVDHRTFSTGFHSESAGDLATDFAYGGTG